jgi:peptide/nickel transport system ATP-binding protein
MAAEGEVMAVPTREMPTQETQRRSGKDNDMSGPNATLLSVENLAVAYGRNAVVRDVGFSLERGQSLALIGESGSGKSTIAKAILRLLPHDDVTVTGSVRLDGRETLGLPERQFRPLRGRALGFIPQDPGSALNPVRTIGSQAHEAAYLLGGTDAEERRSRILAVFEQVGLPDPVRVYNSYPHQLSGGMLQRVLIAMALSTGAGLIVADEPTSALDVTVQAGILDLILEIQERTGVAVLLITHDLGVARLMSDRIHVMKAGRFVESGPVEQVVDHPQHEYTQKLLAAIPALGPWEDPDAALTTAAATPDADDAAPVEDVAPVGGSAPLVAEVPVDHDVPVPTTNGGAP